MIRVVMAAAEPALVRTVRGALAEVDDAELVAVAATSEEFLAVMLADDVDVALVHHDLGPEPVLTLVAELTARRPATAVVLLADDVDAALVALAMESGARALVPLPFAFGQLESRLAAAAAWSATMRRALADGTARVLADDGRARVIGIAGGKGGVGASTVACHLAVDVARTLPALEVCLVDLDLEKGDIPALLDIRSRTSLADLAGVADDLSADAVEGSLVPHVSGVDVLLAPTDVRDVAVITPAALRIVVGALRARYDLLLVDLGSHATPAQATVVELCDEVVVVVTPDVPAVRGLRRLVTAWESLGVAEEADLQVLVNRSSKKVTMSGRTVQQLTRAQVLPVELAAGFLSLEPALNARDPFQVRSRRWWSDLRRLGSLIGMVPRSETVRRRIGAPPGADATRLVHGSSAGRAVHEVADGGRAADDGQAADGDQPGDGGRTADAGRVGDRSADDPVAPVEIPSSQPRRKEAGSATLEFLGVLPVFLVVCGVVWHFVMVGTTMTIQVAAASAAARAVAVGQEPAAAARRAVPAPWDGELSATVEGGEVVVVLGVPAVLRGIPGIAGEVRTSRPVVMEP
ncbi:MAG: AAA family ATPase [Phycicoccus sp.]